MVRDPYKYFRIEARELLDQLSRGALDLEKQTTPQLVAQMLRLAHTLKGAARVVKRPDIGDRAHAIEDILSPLRDSSQQATKTQIDALLLQLDEIGSSVATLSQPAPTVEAENPAPASVAVREVAAGEMVPAARIDADDMDALLDGFTELHAQLGSFHSCQRLAADIRNLVNLLNLRVASQPQRMNDVRNAQMHKRQTQDFIEQIVTSFGTLQRNLASGIEQFDRELARVRDSAERMRLVPAETLFVMLERAARDAAQFQNKDIVFEARGGAVRLDARILDVMQKALAHAVRNAVVHGIETAAEREAAGKPAKGKIAIEVSQRGRDTVFKCIDDGGGIDFDAIRRIAEQRSLLAAVDKPADNDALLQLLLKGGISTSGSITEIAGRGVGLDVVRDGIEQLHGKLDLTTEAGRGTTLILTVPLSIAALDVLQVEAANVITSIPMESIRRTLRITTGELVATAQGHSFIHDGQRIPFLPLSHVLSRDASPVRGNHRSWSVVIVAADCGVAAMGVDRLRGASDVVLRPLPALAPASAAVAGVSLDMEGNAQLVLDPKQLVLQAQHASVVVSHHGEERIPVLVVDDSLTTRMLERSILESAGYDVELAVSGEDAIEKASRNRYALFLVDVEMPGMDGFTFIERIRSDPKLHDIPAILVTSRASAEDLQRGRDVGANGHIVKSEFNQAELLSRIGELVR